MKKVKFSDYKKITRLSYNDFNRWIKTFFDGTYQMGVDAAVANGVARVIGPSEGYFIESDRCDTAIYDDDLRALLLSVKGIGEHKADEIMKLIHEAGVDKSIFEKGE